MRRRHGKINRLVLIALAVIGLVLFALEQGTARYRRVRFYEQKIESAKLSRKAFQAILEYRQKLGVPIDTVNDPDRTGLVGIQYSALTWGRSDLSDALTTLNPNFAAAVVELLLRARVRSGDTVGISWDGTYPALNIHVLAAVRSLGLYPVIVTSQSAGMWGANYPGLTWLDMEKALVDAGVFNYRTVLATLGGEADDGSGFSPEVRELLAATAESVGVECFVPASLEAAVERRLRLFQSARAVVSVGRVAADLGDPMARIPSGILFARAPRMPSHGTIAALLTKKIPVIHLGNPRRIAQDYGLPVAPHPLPEIGRGRLFFQKRFSVPLAAAFLVVLLLLLFIVVRYDVESYLTGREVEKQEAV